METDRRLSDYMQNRNKTAYRVSRVIALQFLILAIFLCAYMVLQDSGHMSISLGPARRIVIIATGLLEVLAVIYGIYTAVAAFKPSADGRVIRPDEPGLRQSRDIIAYAYDKAKSALTYKITLAIVMLTTSMLARLIIITLTKGSEKGSIIGKIILMLGVMSFFLLFVPSYDRQRTYKALLDNSVLSSKVTFTKAKGILLAVMAPIAVYIFVLWKFFGNKRTIAWIVFAIALLLYLAIASLMDYSSGENPL